MFRPVRVAPRAPAAHHVTRAAMRPSVPLRAPLHTATAGATPLSMSALGARRTLTTAAGPPPPAAPAPDAPASPAPADPAAAASGSAASAPRKIKAPRPPLSTEPADTLVKHAANKAAAIGPKSAKQPAVKPKTRFPRNAVWRPASDSRKPTVLSRPRERAPPEVYENSLKMMEMVKAKKFDDALFFVKKLEEFGPPPNTVMYNALIHALSTNNRMADAMRVLADLEAHPTRRPDAPIYNSLMTQLVKDAKYEETYELFERMRANFVLPDEITFSILCNASKKAEQLEKFGHWLKTMQRFGLKPSVAHYNIMMDGYAKAAAIDKMQELLIEMQKNSIPPSEFIYSSLITVFTRLGMIEKIMDTYRFAKADGAANSVVLTQVMQIALQHKKQDVANEIFTYMKENSIPFNTRIASVVSAQLGRTTNDPSKTRALVDHVAATGSDSIHVRTSHLAHLFRTGDAAKAKEFFAAMLKDGPAPTLQTFNAYLHGVLTQPDAQSTELSEVLGLMQERGIEPDTVTFSVVIKYYVGKGEEGLAAATRLIQSLEARDDLGKNIQQCYGPLVSFYFRSNKPEMAEAIYERIKSRFPPSIVLQRTMFYGFMKRGEPEKAELYLPIMNVQMRNDLVERYVRKGMLDRASDLRKRISEEMSRAREAAAAKPAAAGSTAEKTDKEAEAAEAAAWEEATKIARLREAMDINKV